MAPNRPGHIFDACTGRPNLPVQEVVVHMLYNKGNLKTADFFFFFLNKKNAFLPDLG